MADDSELDYVRTFVGEAMTGYTIKHFSEVRNVSMINDTQRGLVYPSEIITANDVYYTSRFKLKLSDATEAALTTGLRNLFAGIATYNRRQTGVTQVAEMTHIRARAGSKSFEVGSNRRWNVDVSLDIMWSVN